MFTALAPADAPAARQAVALRVVAIDAYRHPLDCLGGGMTGALTLAGPGRECLRVVPTPVVYGAWLLTADGPPRPRPARATVPPRRSFVPSRRAAVGVLVWGLRLAAVGSLAAWGVPHREYEATDLTERTYVGYGWPTHWLASEVELRADPVRLDMDRGVVPNTLRKRGPLTAWEPQPTVRGVGDGYTYRAWSRCSLLVHGPVWPTALGGVVWLVARYLGQFRRPRLVAAPPAA